MKYNRGIIRSGIIRSGTRIKRYPKCIYILFLAMLFIILLCIPPHHYGPFSSLITMVPAVPLAHSGCKDPDMPCGEGGNPCLVGEGSVITIIASVCENCGPLENVETSVGKPGWVDYDGKKEFNITISGSDTLSFVVKNPPKSGGSGTISVKLTSNPSEGLDVEPQTKEWNIAIESPGETDNSDPTYIQPNYLTPYAGPTSRIYQFSPKTSPGLGDTVEIEYDLPVDSLLFVRIYDKSGRLVRSLLENELYTAGEITFIWDGKNNLGEFVPDGAYDFVLFSVNVLNISQVYSITKMIIVDNDTQLVAGIDYIKKDTPWLDHYSFIGSVTNDNLSHFTLSCHNGDPPLNFAHSQHIIIDDLLGILDASLIDEGEYKIQLTTEDMAGNMSNVEVPLLINKSSKAVKVHIDSIIQNPQLGSSGYVPTSDEPRVWIEDSLPQGATSLGDWFWDTRLSYSGMMSHTNIESAGFHRHYFIHANETINLTAGFDNIIQYVYLDPANPPRQILIQFYTDHGDGEHRAYWGNNELPTGGRNGTASLYHMGNLPEKGKWVRLKIPAVNLGLSGQEIKGMAFATSDGKAYWDKTTTSTDYNEKQKTSWMLASQITTEDSIQTIIQYALSEDADMTLSIFDEENYLVKTLINGCQKAGAHQAIWDGTDLSDNYVPSGKYYFQFFCPDQPIESNTYAEVQGDWSSEIVEGVTQVEDLAGNKYMLDFEQQAIQKYNAENTLVWTLAAKGLGLDHFTPLSLELDEHSNNLFLLDGGKGEILSISPEGYKLDLSWDGSGLLVQQPQAISIDEKGDLLVSAEEGNRIQKFSPGRGEIEVRNLMANIRVPYEDSLLYAYIPIIGTAAGRGFSKYVVDYGYGQEPQTWTTMVTGYNEVFDDHAPLGVLRTLSGNLTTWQVTGHPYDRSGGLPMGIYTIRLRVYDYLGAYQEDRVRVQVARVVGWDGGIIPSEDGLVTLHLPSGAIADDQELFSIHPIDAQFAPPISEDWVFPVGQVYEIKPAGYQFTKPCTLKMYYTSTQATGFNESTLKIYRWNPLIQRWIYVEAELDMQNNVLTTTLAEFNEHQVYYAIMSDPPPAPIIYQPASPTHLQVITIFGKTTPSVKVEILVNNLSQGTVEADVNSGHFIKQGIRLEVGENIITAMAIDPMGNNSELSEPVIVQVVLSQPTTVESLLFKTYDFSADLIDEVTLGDLLFIELVGVDNDPAHIGSVMVTLTSSQTDQEGIEVQLPETAVNSGVYRGISKVGEVSEASSATITVSATLPEIITLSSAIDPAVFDEVCTRDKIPPPAPAVSSPTHPSLCQETFEKDLGQWQNKSNIYGASVSRSDEAAASGYFSVKLVNTKEGGDFANYVRTSPFEADLYPIIHFDYLIPEGLKINLIAYVNGMWKEILFTDDPKTVETFDEDLYRTIGLIEGVVADGEWHQAQFNLYNLLKNDDPGKEHYLVEEFFFADYNLTGWMELVMGNENPQGTAWYVDNFIITQGGNNSPEFTWRPDDASVVEYSYILDQEPDTLPDEVSDGSDTHVSYDDLADGIWYFHVRSLDGGGNWGPANHYMLMIDTSGPIADTPEPADGSISGSLEVKVRLTDGNGSGVCPDTIVLQLNEVTYDIGSGGLAYDEKTGLLSLALWKVFPTPDPWLHGEVVQAHLLVADDYAGNHLSEVFSWSWTVDYTQLSGGYLTLLTTQGGYSPSWSFDGEMIVFMSDRSGNEDIWVIAANDYAEQQGTARQLTMSEAGDHHPAWSPTDNRIAFVSDRDGYDHIYCINADGTGLTQLTFGQVDDSHPTWSPDGLVIAFSRGAEIWMVDADGTDLRQITFDSIEYYLDPVWSPDGKSIAFTKSLYVDEVAIMNADGTQDITLTESGRDLLPTWSKQTDQIIFVSKRDQKTSAIWVMKDNGSMEESFISNENIWWDTEPEQSPVNENMAFQSTRNGLWNIWVKTQLQLTEVTASPATFSPNNDGIKDSVDIRFTLLGGTAPINLKIYDRTGNLMTTLFDHEFISAGENIVSWDGTDNTGNILPDGTYVYKIMIGGSAGAGAIEKSGNMVIDTTPPLFKDWLIPDLKTYSQGPQNISVNVSDQTSINSKVTKIQYGLSNTADEPAPSVVTWTDLGNSPKAILDLTWSQFEDNYLYFRGYAEDEVGNRDYSDLQKELIDSDNQAPKLIHGKITSPDQMEITFSEEMLGAEIIDLYHIAGLQIITIEKIGETKYQLIFSEELGNSLYELVVSQVTDLAGNTIDPLFNSLSFGYEICDGLDNDGDGDKDEGCAVYYYDEDGDGFGDPHHSIYEINPPGNYVPDHTDCDDTNSGVNPEQVNIFEYGSHDRLDDFPTDHTQRIHLDPSCPGLSLYEFLETTGKMKKIESLHQYRGGTGSWESTFWFFGKPAGKNIIIDPDQVYLIDRLD